MLNIIFSVYIAMSIYYTIQNIKESIKQKTIDDDINRKWDELNDHLYYIKCTILRKEYAQKRTEYNKKNEKEN
jgi:hypothetical protein